MACPCKPHDKHTPFIYIYQIFPCEGKAKPWPRKKQNHGQERRLILPPAPPPSSPSSSSSTTTTINTLPSPPIHVPETSRNIGSHPSLQVLQGRIMTFVNQIAEIIHGVVDEFHWVLRPVGKIPRIGKNIPRVGVLLKSSLEKV